VGRLIDGKWTADQLLGSSKDGRYERKPTTYRNWITPDGAPGPTGEGGFKAEPGRYHLYVSLACPWAHRTLIFRALKGLESLIAVSVVAPRMPNETGWTFTLPGSTGDALHGAEHLWELYVRADPAASGRVTVPVLWDRERETIVNNESSEIIRILNSAFNGLTGNEDDYYPEALRAEIDSVNARVYDTINNGVYKAGFARSQEAYDEAVHALFDSLDWVEARLGETAYLVGDSITEADWRLFTTLVRFDPVYHGHFKCNRARIADYPNLSHYLRGLYHVPGIRETVSLEHITTHYYWSHEQLNPSRIVPVGFTPDYMR
jgi:putative glutathione S-transferase